ncbi:MAG: hypothetical protein HY423_09315 [Candidatus Lambdaproteobacteria bacterium]|nr:hypothetical protein [Candidatus Lambdaproteobacteria bacterium]
MAAALALALPAAGGVARAASEAPPCPDFRQVCLQAERTGGIDLKSGVAFMEGNVTGFLKTQELTFQSQVLRAYRNERDEWVRLVLDREVKLDQPGRTAAAEHGILEQETILLMGNVKLTEHGAQADAQEVLILRDRQRTELKGSPQQQVRMRFVAPPEPRAAQPDTKPPAPGPAQKSGEPPTDTLLARANEVVLEQKTLQAQLTGAVYVERVEREWRLNARTVNLRFTEERKLAGFRAEGGVRIDQPGRMATADLAFSQNDNRTILLVGRAKLQQQGQFDLSSDRIEIYSEADKGVVQTQDRQKPMRLSLNLPAAKSSYRLDRSKWSILAGQGVPRETLDKLVPLQGRAYGNRDAFLVALGGVLTRTELDAYQERILSQAQ